jgi:hypothetical protein
VKTAKPNMIRIKEEPDTSNIKITVHNVYDCDLTDTVLTDRIRQHEGDPDFQLVAADPKPKSPSIPTGTLREEDVVWELGTIPKHTARTVSLDLKSAEHGGVIRDIATAVGKMANCTGEDSTGLAIAGLTLTGLSNPVDIAIEIPRTGPASFSTAVRGSALAVIAFGLAWTITRRRRLFRRT